MCDTRTLRCLPPPPPPPPLHPLCRDFMLMYNIYYKQLEYIKKSQKKEKLHTGIRLHAKKGKRKIYTSRKEKVIYALN